MILRRFPTSVIDTLTTTPGTIFRSVSQCHILTSKPSGLSLPLPVLLYLLAVEIHLELEIPIAIFTSRVIRQYGRS
jgi:hypothetical protein